MRGGFLAALLLLSVTPAGLALPQAAYAAEQNAPAAKLSDPSALALSAAQRVQMQFGAGPIPGALLVPAPQFSGRYLAPSDTAWRTSPMEQAFSSEGFVVWTQPPVVPKVSARTPVTVPLPLPRPQMLASIAPVAMASLPAETPAAPVPDRVTATQPPPAIEALIVRHAERFDLPARLVRRMVWKESKFDPKARRGPYWGLMQIRVDTARGLGFRGAPADLLDADINLTYAVAYLANAYRVAGRNERRAEALYSSGYYYEAKRKGMLGVLIKTASAAE